jgi:hypothetical protein
MHDVGMETLPAASSAVTGSSLAATGSSFAAVGSSVLAAGTGSVVAGTGAGASAVLVGSARRLVPVSLCRHTSGGPEFLRNHLQCSCKGMLGNVPAAAATGSAAGSAVSVGFVGSVGASAGLSSFLDFGLRKLLNFDFRVANALGAIDVDRVSKGYRQTLIWADCRRRMDTLLGVLPMT